MSLRSTWDTWRRYLEEPQSTAPVPLSPVVVVEDLTKAFDSDSRELREASGVATRNAVAVEFSHIELFNPAGSGVLVHVETLIPIVGTNSEVQIITESTQSAGALNANVAWRDRRLPGDPAAQMRTFTNVALQGDVLVQQIWCGVSTQSRTYVLDFVLNPGTGLIVADNTVNVLLRSTLKWVERDLPFR